ncbi:MAG: DUF4178 domain-containing protein [Anaerolineae bacterium]
MSDFQQTIRSLANVIPGYAGYQAKESRRDADKTLRDQLASQYEAQRDRITRLTQQATTSDLFQYLTALERANQQLQRVIARLRTAPRGYAGWFDAAQIKENDLDQIYQFDSALASGVEQLSTALDHLTVAIRNNDAIPNQLAALTDVTAGLNTRLDAREQYLAMGKLPASAMAPTPASTPAPQPQVTPITPPTRADAPPLAFDQLKLGDSFTFGATDYVVAGRIIYSGTAGPSYAYLLQNHEPNHWLRVAANGQLAMTLEIPFTAPMPLPDTLTYSTKTYTRAEQGVSSVSVEGPSGIQSGSVNYTRYDAESGGRFWIENWGNETRAQVGQVVAPTEIKQSPKLK